MNELGHLRNSLSVVICKYMKLLIINNCKIATIVSPITILSQLDSSGIVDHMTCAHLKKLRVLIYKLILFEPQGCKKIIGEIFLS